MWWFTKNASGDSAPALSAREQDDKQLLELMPDLSPALGGERVAIKIWLPVIVARTVKYLAGAEGESQSAWLRNLLVVYTYGRAAVSAQRVREEQLRYDVPRFSRKPVDRTQGRWVYLVPQLGKNTVAFKLWVSKQQQRDLQILADHAKVPLSAFVREVIIADLVGHASLPERPDLYAPVPDASAQAWELGEDVPMSEVDEQRYDGLGDHEVIWQEPF